MLCGFGIHESIKPCWIFFLSCPHPYIPLPFSLFRFLASDTSSSSLSRTESPLQLFVSSHLPHPKPDIFVWPHPASPYCDQVPEPCSPTRCKLAFYSWWACLCCIFLIIFIADKPWLNRLCFNSVSEIWPFSCLSLNTAWVLGVSMEKTLLLIPKEIKLQTYLILCSHEYYRTL